VILADSSALIEFYRPDGNPAVQAAVTAAIGEDRLATNGIIQVEVVGFAANQEQRRRLSADFSAFHWLSLDARIFAKAARLAFDLRRSGLTIPSTDLIIAANAIAAGAELLHVDNHFSLVAEHSALRCRAFTLSAG